MNHHEYRVSATTGSEGADIFFFGDEQEGSEGFRTDAWQAFKDDWARSKNPYAIHMGDAGDFLRPSMRLRVDEALTKDRTAKKQLDELVRARIEKTAERLEFIKGRFIGMHEGHHDWDFLSGATGTMLLAEYLKAPNYGWVSSTRFVLSVCGSKFGYVFTIASSHGNASGRDTTSVARSMENSMKDYVCDLKVQGHACRKANWEPHEYRLIKRTGPPGEISVTPRHLLVGGFCESYTDGWHSYPKELIIDGKVRKIGGNPKSGYAERRNLSKQPLSWGVVRIRIRKNAALARSRGNNPRDYMLDIEVVNRGPSVGENGLYY